MVERAAVVLRSGSRARIADREGTLVGGQEKTLGQ